MNSRFLLKQPTANIGAQQGDILTNSLLLYHTSYYELKEATTIIELAMWKTKIEEIGAVTAEERSACRVAVREVPGLAKYAIIQYLEVDISVNGNESDDSSQYSDRSEWW